MPVLHVSNDLHAQLKLRAIHHGKKLGDLANEIITDALYQNTPTTHQGK